MGGGTGLSVGIVRNRTSAVTGPALLALCLAAAAALPSSATARETYDLAISQTVGAHVVKPGQHVPVAVTVANHGSAAQEAFFEIGSLRAHGKGADNPYSDISPSQGTCKNETGSAYGYVYQFVVCSLGMLAPGATAKVTATVEANETAVHSAILLPNAYEGGYQDDQNGDNASYDRITVSVPPVVKGSKKVRIQGLPAGCVIGDFPLTISTAAPGVKKLQASLDLGIDAEGVGHSWKRVAHGSRLHVTVPASQISEPVLGAIYTIHIKAKRGAAGALERTVEFQLC